MAKKVYVGIGHGGSDSGACANGFKEKDLTLSIGKYCDERLKAYGVSTKISRTTDKDVSIDTKVAESDNFKADICMDIHINAGGGNGCEIYYSGYRADKAKSKSIASNIETQFKAIGQVSRGLKTKSNSAGNADYFGMVRRPDAPSVLIECGFIDNKTDLARFDTAAEQKKFGYAIADGIAKYLNLKLTEVIDMATFKKGDNNNGVFAVKIALLQLKREGIITQGMDANGAFGDGTIIAVKQVQAKAKLPQTGIVDTATLKAINTLLENAEKSDNNTVAALKSKIAKAQAALK